MYKISSDIPIPEPTHKETKERQSCYPFIDLKVGDSFFVPCSKSKQGNLQRSILASIRAYRKKGMFEGWEFTTRKEDNGIRCWRTK